MSIGHQKSVKSKQSCFFAHNANKWKHQLSHGGELRKKQLGRGARPLSTKEPIHAVFKIERLRLRHRSLRAPQNFKLVLQIVEKYAQYFAVKIEQFSVQNDHVHLLIRTSRRRQFHHFFRVVAGQIAQRFEKEGLLSLNNCMKNCKMTDTPKAPKSLWRHRPFTRVVRGWRAYRIIRNYIQLNEKKYGAKFAIRKTG